MLHGGGNAGPCMASLQPPWKLLRDRYPCSAAQNGTVWRDDARAGAQKCCWVSLGTFPPVVRCAISETMRNLSLLLLLSASGLSACSTVPPPTCEEPAGTACFRGVYRTLVGGRVEGVVTCAPELDDIDCVVSDEDGTWKMPGLPADTDVLITSTHESSLPVVYPQHSSMAWYDWYKTAVPEWVMESNADRLDASLDPERGHLLFLVWEGLNIDGEDTPNVPGVQGSLSDASARIFYTNNLGLVDSEATETGSLGQGGVLNLEPGTYTLTLTAPAGPCVEHSFSWQMDDSGNIPVPIRAGFTTAIDVICPVQ